MTLKIIIGSCLVTKQVVLPVFLSALLLAATASAETMRCAGHIIEKGMTRDEVSQYCGPPDEQSTQGEISWSYLNAGHQMKHIVYFYNNGKVERIESQSTQ
jgi:hypothetical protein